MHLFKDKTILITGGTDGIGSATALKLCSLGANIIIFGRSLSKANHLIEASKNLDGTIRGITQDFSLMRDVELSAHSLERMIRKVDVVIHCVGIILTRAEYTKEGLEKNFAVSYLSRFVFNETLYKEGYFHENTQILNVAASAPKVPKFSQMEFDTLDKVEARKGMKGHGQAQLANDLYTAIASKRYHLTSIGYGPGSVDTNIRREIPKWIRVLMKPFFKTRQAEEVANHLIEILKETFNKSSNTYFYDKNGLFEINPFIANLKRQNDLLNASKTLMENAFIQVF